MSLFDEAYDSQLVSPLVGVCTASIRAIHERVMKQKYTNRENASAFHPFYQAPRCSGRGRYGVTFLRLPRINHTRVVTLTTGLLFALHLSLMRVCYPPKGRSYIQFL